ncbi:MAG: DUF692 domain-containing protein [Alphaproteobacteria bacterium]
MASSPTPCLSCGALMPCDMTSYPLLGFGLGLRAPHYDAILRDRPDVDWFEILTENYLDAHGGYREFLTDLRRDYPLVMHGVGMSIGGDDPLDQAYLQKLRGLEQQLRPSWVSDHLCFTTHGGHNTHDLLPIPYTESMLRHVAARVRQVQDFLGRPLVLENPSTYLAFKDSTIPEWEFLARLAQDTGCGLLLDVNNVYVSAFNHGYDAQAYIDAIPATHIAQIHLAGHCHKGTHIIDTHDAHVADPVWELYATTIRRKGRISTMIEWDAQIPPFATMQAELALARRHAAGVLDAAA